MTDHSGKKNILYILNSSSGGATQGIIELLYKIDRNKYTPYIITPNQPNSVQRADGTNSWEASLRHSCSKADWTTVGAGHADAGKARGEISLLSAPFYDIDKTWPEESLKRLKLKQ